VPAGARVGIVAVAVTALAFTIVRWQASKAIVTAGFRFEAGSYALPEYATRRLGGPLTEPDIESIKEISRREVERAFAGTRMIVTQNADAFWHVEVLQTLHETGPLPNAGRALVLGPLGGAGEVSFAILALAAVRLAPAGATRQTIVEGIGRGIGRAAVHELAHQIVATAAMDDNTDPDSYEYSSFDRASQYYGDVHWSGAWPIVQRKIGK
jgi:hypothetical protein